MGTKKSNRSFTYCCRGRFHPWAPPEILVPLFSIALPGVSSGNTARKKPKLTIGHKVKSIIQAALQIVSDRTRLVKLEARNAKSSLRKIGRLSLAGIILFTGGYSLLVWMGVRVSSTKFGINIDAALAITAAIHIFAGILCLLAARVRSRRARFFRNSLTEINRDRKWLQGIKDKLKSKP